MVVCVTRRRWIADEVKGDRAYLTGQHAAHLSRVLRVRVGQQFDISAEGQVRRASVFSVSDEQVEFALGEPIATVEPLRITVLLAIIKFDRIEWAIEKLTELGVAQIIPVAARRTDPHLAAAARKRVERWRRIALEAAEQSRRRLPPELQVGSFRDALATGGDCKLLLNENEPAVRVCDLLSAESEIQAVALAVGPEGGWTGDEIAAFQAAAWQSVSLGPTILRAETAAVAAVASVLAVLGA